MDELLKQARDLGMDHAAAEHAGKRWVRLYGGRDVAESLGVARELTGEEFVALRGAYEGGYAAYW